MLPKKFKGLRPVHREQALEKSSGRLETNLQPELQLTFIQSASGLAEVSAAGVFVVGAAAGSGEKEVGVVEHVEAVGVELHVHAFGKLEGLRQRHIGIPLARTNE
jgi:hypothetical protein